MPSDAAAPRTSTPPPGKRPAGAAALAAANKEAANSPAAKAPAAGTPKPSFGVIYLTVFLDFFANGVMLPVLQSHAKRIGASGFNVGMVFTAYSAAQIPGSFLFGRLSDFVGRRPIIVVSLLMSSVTSALTLAAPELGSLVAARALAGFFSETGVCQAYVADKTTREDRAAALGHLGAFIGLAFVLGPATGAVLGHFGEFALAVKFTVGVTLLNLVYAHVKLDESLPSGPKAAGEPHGETIGDASLGLLVRTWLQPVIALVLVGQFALTLAFMGWDTTFAVWADDRLGYSQRHSGWAFSWLAVGFFLASWKTRAFAKDPANSFAAGIFGCVLMAGGLLGHRLISSTLSMLPPLFGIGFGYALSEIVFQSLVSVHSPVGLQGSLLGSLSASQALARAVAPVLAGYLFDIAPSGDSDFAYVVLSAAPAAAGVITAVAYAFIPAAPAAEKNKRA